MQVAIHPVAAQFMTIVPIEEGHLERALGAIVRADAMLKCQLEGA